MVTERACASPARAWPQHVPPWRALVLGVLLVAFSLPTLWSLLPVWENYEYSHAYLVLAVVALFVTLEVRRRPLNTIASSWAGLACLLGLVLVSLAGMLSTTEILSQVALPAVWMAAVWTTFGSGPARRLALPLAYTYFAIPIWNLALQPLQNLTVFVVSAWIRAVSVPAYIDGNLIQLPSGNFEVMEGCAGLRYAIVAMALAAFGALLNRRRWGPGALFVVAAFALALLGNWVRVFTIVVVGYASDMQHYLVADDHMFFGWAVFLVFMLPLFYVDRLFESKANAVHAAARSPSAPRTAGRWSRGAISAGCVVLAAGTWGSFQVVASTEPLPAATMVELPDVAGWDRTAVWQDMRRPRFFGASAEAADWYVDAANRVGVYLAYYATQRQGAEVVFSQNRPAGESAVVHEARVPPVNELEDVGMPFRELVVADRDGAARLVWVVMRVAGRPVIGRFAAKGLQLLGALHGRRDAQVLVLTARCADDCSDARAVLTRYAGTAAVPLLAQAEQLWGSASVPSDLEDDAR